MLRDEESLRNEVTFIESFLQRAEMAEVLVRWPTKSFFHLLGGLIVRGTAQISHVLLDLATHLRRDGRTQSIFHLIHELVLVLLIPLFHRSRHRRICPWSPDLDLVVSGKE